MKKKKEKRRGRPTTQMDQADMFETLPVELRPKLDFCVTCKKLSGNMWLDMPKSPRANFLRGNVSTMGVVMSWISL